MDTRVVFMYEGDADNVRAELWCERELWAEVERRGGEWRLLVWPRPQGTLVDLPLDKVRDMIDEAVSRITVLESVGSRPDGSPEHG